MIDDTSGVAFGRARFRFVGYLARDTESVGVEGRLGDEAVGEWDTNEAGDAGCEAQEEDVPVEAGGFAEGKFGALGY